MARRYGEGRYGEGTYGIGKPTDNFPEDDTDVEELFREIDNRLRAIENQNSGRDQALAKIERDLHDLDIQMNQSDLVGWIQFSISISLALGVQPTPLAVFSVIGVWVLYVTSLNTSQ